MLARHPDDPAPNLILIGFSGSGKSSVGRRLAERLGWRFVDLDDLIAARAGKDVPAIFAEDGEGRFREWESALLREVCAEEHAVVSTGGGIVVDATNRELMLSRGYVVCLEARPTVLLARLQRHQAANGSGAVRPLLAGDDPLSRIAALKDQRQAYYAACHATVHTDGLSEEEVAEEVHRHLARAGLALSPGEGEGPVSVKTAAGYYHVHVGEGLLGDVGALIAARHPQARLFLVADENVDAVYGARVSAALRGASAALCRKTVPAGETSKSLRVAEALYDWLIESGAERSDVLVALGGGVIGDLVGFVAATFLRGVSYVQLPTSLLAMVDSSVGGKTAVDHRLGKNLIGAFHPPSLVVADVAALRTLPARELRSGWAEVIKHAMALDPALFTRLEAEATALRNLDPRLLVPVVRRNVWLKASVVAADEREQGRRIILNYGHTVGHAVESVAGYALAHGEAVAVGMVAAANIAVAIGWLAPEDAARQRALLQAYGLPTSVPASSGVRLERVLEAMGRDKKSEGRALRWVLPTRIGCVEVARNVPYDLVQRTLEALLE